MNIHNVLFATCEISPRQVASHVADMTMHLPPAIKTLRRTIYVVAPAYPDLMSVVKNITPCGTVEINDLNAPVTLHVGKLPGSSVKLLLAEIPHCFEQQEEDGTLVRNRNCDYARFCQVVTAIAEGKTDLDWQPELVHCNGWQTGLVPAMLAQNSTHRPATLFTLYNPEEQHGMPYSDAEQLQLLRALADDPDVISDGTLSFTRAALRYADMVSTTSPTYAHELCDNDADYDNAALLKQRESALHGILNGVNYKLWNPAKDRRLPRKYNSYTLDDKVLNKMALQRAFSLPPLDSCCLIGMIGELSTQKGTDLLLQIIPELLKQEMQLILLGKGENHYISQLRDICMQNPEQIAAHIRDDNPMTHLILGGADIFLTPSRIDPCAELSRLALRYGTIPAVTNSGALADSVIDTNESTLATNTASGFLLDVSTPETLLSGLNRAISLQRRQPREWKKIAVNAMQQDFSWRKTAKQYIDLYKKTIEMQGNGNVQV